MDAVLLDTDVFSYLIKSNDPRGDAYRPHVKDRTVAVSFVTVGEIYYGAEKRGWSSKTLKSVLERLKAVVVVPYDEEICKTYGKLKATLLNQGISVADNDLWIAASAVRHSISLISNNRKHFEKLVGVIPGFRLISEAPQKTAPPAQTKQLFEHSQTSSAPQDATTKEGNGIAKQKESK